MKNFNEDSDTNLRKAVISKKVGIEIDIGNQTTRRSKKVRQFKMDATLTNSQISIGVKKSESPAAGRGNGVFIPKKLKNEKPKPRDIVVNTENVQDIMAKFRSHQQSAYIPDKINLKRSPPKVQD